MNNVLFLYAPATSQQDQRQQLGDALITSISHCDIRRQSLLAMISFQLLGVTGMYECLQGLHMVLAQGHFF